MGASPLEAARESAREIAVPVLMATITTMVVFFPLTFMTGVGKHLFTPLAFSACLALGASYLVSRTVSPLLCSLYLKAEDAPTRLPRWLLLISAIAMIIGLGLPGLAHYGAGFLDKFFSHEVGDVIAMPYRLLPPLARRGMVAIGVVGVSIIAIAACSGFAPAFGRFFDRVTGLYERVLVVCLKARIVIFAVVIVSAAIAAILSVRIGQELFPEVDSSEFTIHLRATGGPRVETTELKIQGIDALVREIVPAEDLKLTLANVGLSSRWSAIYTPNNGPHAAFLRVQLRSGFDGRHTPTRYYVEEVRQKLNERYPSDDFFFETGGMVRQILNGGALAPIEVQVHGRDLPSRRAVAKALEWRISRIPQVSETYMPQAMDLPQLSIEVDRTAAARLKLTQTDVVRNVITSLMSSAQLAPNFWIDPNTGNPYIIGVQYPEAMIKDVQTLETVPLTPASSGTRRRAPLLRDVATIRRSQGPVEAYHYDSDRVSQLFVQVNDNNLGRIAGEIERIVDELPLTYAVTILPKEALLEHAIKTFPPDKGKPREDLILQALLRSYFHDEEPEVAEDLFQDYSIDVNALHLGKDARFRDQLENYLDLTKKADKERARQEIQAEFGVDPEPLRLPKGIRVTLRGEVASMRDSFAEMGFNLALAVLLVYLIMAAQFSSWLDPLIMIVAAPLGLVGVVGLLWATNTSLNVQSLMGVLLMVGISVSNSVLLVEFANHLMEHGKSAYDAVVEAARTRLRPIMMTTIATILGLLPMAIHLHPGDEMNLPLARAVIGGLAVSTLLTLFVVPVLYVLLKRAATLRAAEVPAGGSE
jgi:multidrug efflux pump subunit AcrB